MEENDRRATIRKIYYKAAIQELKARTHLLIDLARQQCPLAEVAQAKKLTKANYKFTHYFGLDLGIDSKGMIISAICEYDGEEKLNLIMLDDNIPAGSKLY